MFPNYTVVIQAVLLVFGILWCRDVLLRFQKDLAEVKGGSDLTTKGVVVAYWILTIGVAGLIVSFAAKLIQRIMKYL